MKRIAILLLVAAPACAAREASERPPLGPQPVEPAANRPPAREGAPPSVPLRAFTHAPNCNGWPAATEVGVERTAHGAAIVFANADHIAPLRDRVAAMPEAKSADDAVRLDNVDEGIRLVYEGSGSAAEIHESARLRARELRRACGLARYFAGDDDLESASAAAAATEAPPAASTPAAGSKAAGTRPSASKNDSTATTKADDKPQSDDKLKAGDKPAAAAPAKSGDKPAVPPPPPDPNKPKDPVKPKPPAPGDPKPPEPPKPPESPFPRT